MKRAILAFAFSVGALGLAAESIRGRVLYEGILWGNEDHPVAVELYSSGGNRWVTRTTTGEFQFEDVPEGGGYEVVVVDPSAYPAFRGATSNICATAVGDPVEVALRFSEMPPDVYLPPATALEGTLSLESGDPARDVDVELFFGQSRLATSRTDEHGRFRFEEVPVYRYVTVVVDNSATKALRETFWHKLPTGPTTPREFVIRSCGGNTPTRDE